MANYRDVYENNENLKEIFPSADFFETWAADEANQEELSNLGVDLTEKKKLEPESFSNSTLASTGLESTSGSDPAPFLKRFYDEQVAGKIKGLSYDQFVAMPMLEKFIFTPENVEVLSTKYNLRSLDDVKKAITTGSVGSPIKQPEPIRFSNYADTRTPAQKAVDAKQTKEIFTAATSPSAKEAYLAKSIEEQNPFITGQRYTIPTAELDMQGNPVVREVDGSDPIFFSRILFDPVFAGGVTMSNGVTKNQAQSLVNGRTFVLNKDNFKQYLMYKGMSEEGADAEILKYKEKWLDYVADELTNQDIQTAKGVTKFEKISELRGQYDKKGMDLITDQYGYEVAEMINKLNTGKVSGDEALSMRFELMRKVGGSRMLYNPATGKLSDAKDAPKEAVAYKKQVDDALQMYGKEPVEKLYQVRDKLFKKVEHLEKVYGKTRNVYLQGLEGNITPEQKEAYKDVFTLLDKYRAQLTALNIRLMANVDIEPEENDIAGAAMSSAKNILPGSDFVSKYNNSREMFRAYVDAVGSTDIELKQEEIDKQEATLGEEVASSMVAMVPIMAEIMVSRNIIGGVEAIRSSKYLRPLTRGVLKLTGSRSVASFATDFTAHAVHGAMVYAPTSESAATGVGETLGSGMVFDKLGLDKFTGKWGKLGTFLTKVALGTTGETFEEYSGMYLDALVESGFDWDKASRTTFGENTDQGIRQLLVIATTSGLMSSAFNTPELFKQGTRYDEVRSLLERVAEDPRQPVAVREAARGAVNMQDQALVELQNIDAANPAEPDLKRPPSNEPPAEEPPATGGAMTEEPSAEAPGEGPVIGPPTIEQTSPQNNAIQKQETTEVPVQPETRSGQANQEGQPQAGPEKTAEQKQEEIRFQLAAQPVSTTDVAEDVKPIFGLRTDEKIGFRYDTEQVARERFDFSNLQKIGSGSDRDVYDIGDGKVLKVAKTARGLRQNSAEGDNYIAGSIIPESHEVGLNYVVVDNVPRAKSSDVVPVFDLETGDEIGTTTFGVMLKELSRFSPIDFDNNNSALQDTLRKYGFDDIRSYNVLWNDFTANRNWGYKDGKALHTDAGTFTGEAMINDYKGVKNLSDPEFRQIYNESRSLKKEYGDTDRNTMYQVAEPARPTPLQPLIDRLRTNFQTLFGSPTEVITDTAEIDRVLSEAGLTQTTGENKVLGFVKDGKVYIDPRTARPDTPIHEFGHIWNSFIKQTNPEFYARGLELIEQEGQAYIDEVKKNYPNLEGEALLEEALTWAISDKGEKLLARETSPLMKWLKDLWKIIGNTLGLTMDPEALRSLTLEKYTALVAGAMLSPEAVGVTGVNTDGSPTTSQNPDIRYQTLANQNPVDITQELDTELKNDPKKTKEDVWKSMLDKGYLRGVMTQAFIGDPSFKPFIEAHIDAEYTKVMTATTTAPQVYHDLQVRLRKEFQLLQQASPSVPLEQYIEDLQKGNTPSGEVFSDYVIFDTLLDSIDIDELTTAFGEPYAKAMGKIAENPNTPAHLRAAVNADSRSYSVTYTLAEAAELVDSAGLGIDAKTVIEYFSQNILDARLTEYYASAIIALTNFDPTTADSQQVNALAAVKGMASFAGRILAYNRVLAESRPQGVLEDLAVAALEKTLPKGMRIPEGVKRVLRALAKDVADSALAYRNILDRLKADPGLINDKQFITTVLDAQAKHNRYKQKYADLAMRYKGGNWIWSDRYKTAIIGALLSTRSTPVGAWGNLENKYLAKIGDWLGLTDATRYLLKKIGVNMVTKTKKNLINEISKMVNKSKGTVESFGDALAWKSSWQQTKQIIRDGHSTAATDISKMQDLNMANQPLKDAHRLFKMIGLRNVSFEQWAEEIDRVLMVDEDGTVIGLQDPKWKDFLSTLIAANPIIMGMSQVNIRALAFSLDRQIENAVIYQAISDYASAKGLKPEEAFRIMALTAVGTDSDKPWHKLGQEAIFMGENMVQKAALKLRTSADKLPRNYYNMANEQRRQALMSVKSGDKFHHRLKAQLDFAMQHVTGMLDMFVFSLSPFVTVPTNVIYKGLLYAHPSFALAEVVHRSVGVATGNKKLKSLYAERVPGKRNEVLEKRIQKAEEDLFYSNSMLEKRVNLLAISVILGTISRVMLNAFDDDEDEYYVDPNQGDKLVRVQKGIMFNEGYNRKLVKQGQLKGIIGSLGRVEDRKTGFGFSTTNMGMLGYVFALHKSHRENARMYNLNGNQSVFQKSLDDAITWSQLAVSAVGTAGDNLAFLQSTGDVLETLRLMAQGEERPLDPVLTQFFSSMMSPIYNNTLSAGKRAEGERSPTTTELREVFINYGGDWFSRNAEQARLKMSVKTPFGFLESKYYKEMYNNFGAPNGYTGRTFADPKTASALAILQAAIDPFGFGIRRDNEDERSRAVKYASRLEDAARLGTRTLQVIPNMSFLTLMRPDPKFAIASGSKREMIIDNESEASLPVPFDLLLEFKRDVGKRVMASLDYETFDSQLTRTEYEISLIEKDPTLTAEQKSRKIDEFKDQYNAIIMQHKEVFDRVYDSYKTEMYTKTLDYFAQEAGAKRLSDEVIRKLVSANNTEMNNRLHAAGVDIDKYR
jgi:hypothetical protein